MPRRSLFVLIALTGLAPVAHAAPTQQQLCESAMEMASAKYAQCRLTAESKDAKTPDPAKLTEAVAKCSRKLSDAFRRSTLLYGGACTATEPSSAFDAYLKQCSDDTVAAATGASLPDYVGELASCNANLSTCSGNLVNCSADLSASNDELATCNADLSASLDDLTACNADLGTSNGDLATCNVGLSACSADLATSTGDLATCEDDLVACQVATAQAQLLRTGQTTNYGPGTDGSLQAGVAHSYIDNGDGTITDTATGLMWEKKSYDGSVHDFTKTYTFGGFTPDTNILNTFLAVLNGGGGFAAHSDWRMPNLIELESIRSLGTFDPAVFSAFNNNCVAGCTVTTCSCTNSNQYWSSSVYEAGLGMWVVQFMDGGLSTRERLTVARARAVRGGL